MEKRSCALRLEMRACSKLKHWFVLVPTLMLPLLSARQITVLEAGGLLGGDGGKDRVRRAVTEDGSVDGAGEGRGGSVTKSRLTGREEGIRGGGIGGVGGGGGAVWAGGGAGGGGSMEFAKGGGGGSVAEDITRVGWRGAIATTKISASPSICVAVPTPPASVWRGFSLRSSLQV
jgi:hypothetical protein